MELLSSLISWTWQHIIIFLLVLTVVVFIHELGHFLVARWCGVTVKAFSIGFGPELFGFNDKHGTRWRFAAIPLGGYVKFVDDENAASKPSPEVLARMSAAEREGSFHAKPVWQRAAVVAAGPIANFLLSIVLYTALNAIIGVRVMPAIVDSIVPETPAARAGFQPGDKILSVDGSKIEAAVDVASALDLAGERELAFVVERKGEQLTLKVTPTVQQKRDDFGRPYNSADIGVRSLVPARVGDLKSDLPAYKAGLKVGDLITAIDGVAVKSFDEVPPLLKSVTTAVTVTVEREGEQKSFQIVPVMQAVKDSAGVEIVRPIIGITRAQAPPIPVSFAAALSRGTSETFAVITQTLSGIKAMLSQTQSAQQMGGPVMMAEVTAKVAELGGEALLRWIAFISANIGFLNLLPIPVLDGGHLMFYAYESTFRKPLSERFQMAGFQVGLALLMMLMAFVFYNDISSIVRRTLGTG